MPPRVSPFADSIHATISTFRPGSTIPPRTHITAIVGGIGGLPTSNTATIFRALLHCEVPNDGQAVNDYVLPKDTGTTRCSFKVQFGYSADQADMMEDAFEEVDRAREALAALIKTKEPFTVDMGGARVLACSGKERTWTVELDAFGQRTFALSDGQPQQLLTATVDSSPTWWQTPAPSSPPASAHVPAPDKSVESPLDNTRLRPITTLPVPPPPPTQPKNKQSPPVPRGQAPQSVAPAAQRRPPSPIYSAAAKRPRISNGRDSSDIGLEALPAFPPHNGFVDGLTTSTSASPVHIPDSNDEPGLIVVREKNRKISAPKKRIQVDAQPAGAINEDGPHDDIDGTDGHDANDVFGMHEDTRSERLDGHSSRTEVPVLEHDYDLGTKASSSRPADISRTSTEGSDAFRFVMGRRQKEIEAQERAAAALQSQTRQSDQSPHTPAREDGGLSPERTANAVAGPSKPTQRRTGPDRLARIRKEQHRLEAEARAEESREVERERAAEQSASAFGLPVRVDGVTYTPLAKLKNGEKRNIMGVVLETPNAAKQVPRGDWLITIVLVDPTSPGHGLNLEGTPVTVFRPEAAELPVVYPGMIVAFRDVKAQFYKEKIKGNLYKPTSRESNSWAHMKKNGTAMTSNGGTLGEQEKGHMRKLCGWWDAKAGSSGERAASSGTPAASPEKGKSKSLSELVPGEFANITVKILYACPKPSGPKGPLLELYVTDGTVHPRPTRNFRELENGTPPSSIWTIAIFDSLDPEVAQHLTEDAYVVLRNVLVKPHFQTGELEMKWSIRLPERQVEQGWKAKTVMPVPRNDYRATQINQRINQLKKAWAENPAAFDNMPIPPRAEQGAQSEHGQAIAPARLSDEIATHLRTVHTDPIRNRISTLAEVKASTQAPNKWRFRARVKALRPRQTGRGENNYVVWYCTRCDRRFDPPACQACADPELTHAELRYWIWAELEDQETTMSVIIANEAAAEFLPPLPPLVASTNPNDKKKMETRVREANRAAEEMLLGAMMDGQRSKPLIEWSVETVEQELMHAGGWKRVIKHLAMGMKSG